MSKLTKKDSATIRKALSTLALLVQTAEMDVKNGFYALEELFINRLANKKGASYATGQEALDKFNLGEDPGYRFVYQYGEGTKEFIDPDQFSQWKESTLFITSGRSLLDEMLDILESLKPFLPKKNHASIDAIKELFRRKRTTAAAKVYQPKAGTDSKVIGDSRKDVVGEPILNPNGTITLTEDLQKTKTVEKPKSKKAKAKSNEKPKHKKTKAKPKKNFDLEQFRKDNPELEDIYAQTVEIARSLSLPAYFDQHVVVTSGKIGAAVYCNCTFRFTGKAKVSKKAIFIDCSLK